MHLLRDTTKYYKLRNLLYRKNREFRLTRNKAQDIENNGLPIISSYEFILRNFRTRRGLYILGAGASVGTAPFGKDFWTAAPIDYLLNAGSIPVDIPEHSELPQRMIDNSRSEDFSRYALEKVSRIPNYFARLYLKHCLSESRFSGRPSDSYRIFQFFYPSLISNYNHDGLAADFAGQFHHVVDMHGTIDPVYGSPRIQEEIAEAREDDLPDAPDDGILMGVPESSCDPNLACRLWEVARFSPDFIAIIGYSFAQNGKHYDDRVSLDFFLHTRRNFRGNIYVIGPQPDALQHLIADGIKSKSVFGVRAYWNVLAHAFMKAPRDQSDRKSLNYVYEQILDLFGSEVAFPFFIDNQVNVVQRPKFLTY